MSYKSGNFCSGPGLERLVRFKAAIYARSVAYRFGAKDPNCGSGLVDFLSIDCSGLSRTLLQNADPVTFAQLPDGSAGQCDWFAAKGFKPETDYGNASLRDGHIRVWIKHEGTHGDPFGHIWLTVNGHTIESYGGHGPGEQPADVYAGIWDAGFLLC